MNLSFERVLELADQVGLIEWEVPSWNPECKTPSLASVAKVHQFSELIVAEVEKEFKKKFVAKNYSGSVYSKCTRREGLCM